uniref:uncharacterized protein K02A2.6-like n=1 Tax=Styela clava TaxID=7725 RepID=UPI00193A2E49|nr:uncharacterized protein K02A2.6-like [Styela clava]
MEPEKIHEGHMGIVKCRRRARSSVWWPYMNKQVEEVCKSCPSCCEFSQTKTQPLIPSEYPDRPWKKIATDLFELKGSKYLLPVDYFSRWIEIALLQDTTSLTVINHLKSIFAKYGIPEVIISDNGPQYAPGEFSKFAEEYGFCHITSSPRYAHCNGEAERAVHTIKNLLKRTKDPYMALLNYRSTALKNGYSPSELLMGRKLRTKLPVYSSELIPK